MENEIILTTVVRERGEERKVLRERSAAKARCQETAGQIDEKAKLFDQGLDDLRLEQKMREAVKRMEQRLRKRHLLASAFCKVTGK